MNQVQSALKNPQLSAKRVSPAHNFPSKPFHKQTIKPFERTNKLKQLQLRLSRLRSFLPTVVVQYAKFFAVDKG